MLWPDPETRNLVLSQPSFTVILIVLPLHAEQVEAYLTLLGLAIGAGVGASIEAHRIQFDYHPEPLRQVGLFFLGIVLVLIVLLGLSPLFDLIAETGIMAYLLRLARYGLAGFTAIALVPMLGIRLGLMKSEAEQMTEATV